jgi:hypothetical protein
MNSICEYCNSTFSKRNAVNRHYLTCKQKPLFEQKIYYESKLTQYETEIQTLQCQLSEQKELVKTYQNQIFEIAKQPKQIHNNNNSNNTTHNNQKTLNIMNQLATYDLTPERVREILDNHSLEKIFKDGPNSIADFVVEKILTDPTTQKPKLIATDRSRGVFKYKDTEGTMWTIN